MAIAQNETYTTVSFINQLSAYVDRFTRKEEFLWNFRCPFCGDSKKNARKARGYIFREKGRFGYRCHNCGEGMGISTFFRRVNVELWKQYRFSIFQQSENKSTPFKAEPSAPPVTYVPITLKAKGLHTIASLPQSHPARVYIEGRLIPKIHFARIWYTDDFKRLTIESLKQVGLEPSKDKQSKMVDGEPRIIIPFYDASGNLIGFQGRSLNPASEEHLKYMTVKLIPYMPKVYGLERLDMEQNFFVVEGPIDSLFLNNSLATMDSALYKLPTLVPMLDGARPIYVYDNQPRNKEVVRCMKESIKLGQTLCIFHPLPHPAFATCKDINDLRLAGLTQEQIEKILLQTSFDTSTPLGALAALANLSYWQKS